MSKIDLKKKTVSELQAEIGKARESLRASRFTIAGTKGIKANAAATRRQIARMLTEINSR